MAQGKTISGPSSFVLMVGDEGAVLIQLQKKRVVRRLFAQSSETIHTRGFDEALNASPKAPITLLVDMMDQSYVRQTLPPVSSFSVGKIVKRRLDKDFSRDDIKGYLILDREKSGRRDWNYLMVALANPPQLQKWIAFTVERSNPFKGIGLVPLESQRFMAAIANALLKEKGKDAKPLEWQLLVSHHKVGGFRQVVFKNGKLVFTRLAQSIGESNPEVIAGNIEQEIINTQEYLKRMGLQDPATCSVIILASSEIKQLLDPKNIKAGECHFFTPYEMAELLSLPDAAQPEDHFGDIILSAYFARSPKLSLILNTPYTEKVRTFSLYIMASRLVAIIAMLAILGWGGMTAWDINTLKSSTEDALHQQKILKSKLDSLKLEEQKLPKQITFYTDVETLVKVLDRRRYDPLTFVNTLSEALADSGLVRNYHWAINDPLAIGKDGTDKRQIQADMETALSVPLQPLAPFLAVAQAMLDHISKSFSDFDVTHSELPGLLSDSKELKTVLDENTKSDEQSVNLVEGNDIIKISIKGPKAAGKNGR